MFEVQSPKWQRLILYASEGFRIDLFGIICILVLYETYRIMHPYLEKKSDISNRSVLQFSWSVKVQPVPFSF